MTPMPVRSAILAAAVLASCGGDSPTAPTTPQSPVDTFTLVLRDQAGQQLEGFRGAWPSADPLFVTLYSVRAGVEMAVEAESLLSHIFSTTAASGDVGSPVEAEWTVEVEDLSSQQAHENPSDVVTLDFPNRPTEARIVCSDPCGYHLMRATVTARDQGKFASFSINCRFG